MLEDLFTEIEKSHTFELTNNPSEIDEFERHCSYELPEDLKTFYRRYKTVKLFSDSEEWQYRFVFVDEIHCVGFDILGQFYEKDNTSSWFTVCDVMDSNYLAIDLASKRDNEWNYIDCFHETFGIAGECKIIAKSFTELLERCLHSGGTLYYLQKGFQGYGDALE